MAGFFQVYRSQTDSDEFARRPILVGLPAEFVRWDAEFVKLKMIIDIWCKKD